MEPIPIKIGEQDCKCSHITQAIQAKYTEYLKQVALETIHERREALGEDRYGEEMRRYLFDCSAGKYGFWMGTANGGYWADYTKLPEHQLQLLWLCLSKCQMVPLRRVREQYEKDPTAILELLSRLFAEDRPKKA